MDFATLMGKTSEAITIKEKWSTTSTCPLEI
jgi:hypothetical protein